jgi:hypothetical protein
VPIGLVMGLDTHMIAGGRACSTFTGLRTRPSPTRQARTLPRPCERAEGGLAEPAQRGRRRTATQDADQPHNEPPTWLARAHVRLDQAVHVAYGWPYTLRDEEILERLIALNLSRAR